MVQENIIKTKKASDKSTQRILESIKDDSLFKFGEIGDMICGKLIEKGHSERYGVGMYTIQVNNDLSQRVLGKTQLDRLMNKIDVGEYVEIEYVDDMNTINGIMMVFDVRKEKRV